MKKTFKVIASVLLFIIIILILLKIGYYVSLLLKVTPNIKTSIMGGIGFFALLFIVIGTIGLLYDIISDYF